MMESLRRRILNHAMLHRNTPRWKRAMYAVLYNGNLITINRVLKSECEYGHSWDLTTPFCRSCGKHITEV